MGNIIVKRKDFNGPPLVVNGKPFSITPDVAQDVPAIYQDVLRRAGIPYADEVTGAFTGRVTIPTDYGPRVPISVNGRSKFLTTGTPLTLTNEEISILTRSGIVLEYEKAGGPAVLVTLTLSGAIEADTPLNGTILNATAGSTIVSNISGLSIDSAARTFAWNGVGIPQTVTNGFVETLAGATGSPKSSPITIGVNTSITIPPLIATRTSAAAALPPTFSLQTTPGHRVGDLVRIVARNASTNAILVEDTVTLAESGMAAAINAKLAGIGVACVVTFRVERPGATGYYSDPILCGDASDPVLTSSPTFTNVETRTFAGAITFATPTYCYIEGEDQALYELVDAVQPGTSFIIRYVGNGVHNYDAPLDFNRDRVSDITIVGVKINGVEKSFPATNTLLDLNTVPDDQTLAPTTGVELSTLTDGPVIDIVNMDASYSAPYYAPVGSFVRKQVAGVWGGWIAGAGATALGTVDLNNKLQARRMSSASYLTGISTDINVNGVIFEWLLTTKADPANVSLGTPIVLAAASATTSGNNRQWAATNIPAGKYRVFVEFGIATNTLTSITHTGSTFTSLGSCTPSGGDGRCVHMFELLSTGGTGALTVNMTFASTITRLILVPYGNTAGSGGGDDTCTKPHGFNGASYSFSDSLVIGTNGVGLVANVYSETNVSNTAYNVGTVIQTHSENGYRMDIVAMNATATLSVTRTVSSGSPPAFGFGGAIAKV